MRLIRGRSGWWCIAESGVALLPDDWVDAGRLAAGRDELLARTGILRPAVPDAYALTVLTTSRCNLACPYCFQNAGPARPGRSGVSRIPGVTLNPDTIEAIVAFTGARMRAAARRKVFLMIFGGEPLANPTGCLTLLRRLGDVGEVSAGLVTNGTLLHPDLATQMRQFGLRWMQVTLDGVRDAHDRARATHSGRGTFDRILGRVAAVQREVGMRCTIRINVSDASLPGLDDLVRALSESLLVHRSVLWLVPVPDAGLSARPAALAGRLTRAYALGQSLGFRLPRPRVGRCAFCAEPAGRLGAVVNADGTLYSCWETAGRPGYEVGTVWSGYADHPPEAWASCTRVPSAETVGDVVDAGLLDMLWTSRRCGPANDVGLAG